MILHCLLVVSVLGLLPDTPGAQVSPYRRLRESRRTEWKTPATGVGYDSLNCRFIGAWPYGPAISVVVDLERDLAFCSSGGGVLAVDITDRADPQVLSDAVRTRGLAGEMCYAESTLYVAAGPGGLEIWDVSDQASPSFLGRHPASDRTWDVEVRDTIAFVAEWEGGLRILSVADRGNVYQLGWYDSPGAAYTLAFYQDTIVFLTDWDEGTQVVNVADPRNPSFITNIPYGDANWGIDIEGNLAYITDFATGLFIYDITDPANPTFLGGHETFDVTDNVFVLDTLAFLPLGPTGTSILNCADPSAPIPLDTITSLGTHHEVVAFDTFAILADWHAGVQFAAFGNLADVHEIARIPTPDASVWVDKSGDYCYVANGKSGLRVIDVTDRRTPNEVGSLDLPGDVAAVFVKSDYAYVANWLHGVRIVDVSDPANPRIAGSFPTRLRCNDIQVVDTLAYVTDDDSGLSIYSVADTADPYFVGSCITGDRVKNLDILGDYAYLADGDLIVVDVSDPTSPFVAGYFLTFDDAWDLVVSWPYALVAYQGGAVDPLRVIDVSDPYHPTLAGSTLLPDWPWGIKAAGDYCYVTCLDSGLRIYDISNPGSPTEVGHYVTPTWALGPDIEDSYIYLASDYAGLGIYENLFLTGVTEPWKSGEAGPAPLPAPTLMRAAELAALEGRLLDIQGREVSRRRRELGPGVYFYQPTVAGRPAGPARRVVVVK